MIAPASRVNIRFLPRMGCAPCMAMLAAPSDEQVFQIGQQAANAAGNVLGILANTTGKPLPTFAPLPPAPAPAAMSNATKLGLVAIVAAAGYLVFRKR